MSTSQYLSTRLILPVSDIYAAIEWYEQVLGLSVRYVHGSKVRGEGEVANFATMSRDEVELHFILDEGGHAWTKAGTGYLNLIVRDVDLEFSRVTSKGISVVHEVQVQDWGARAFKLNDPSGNEILVEQVAVSQAVELARLRAADARERAEKFLGWASHHEPGRQAAAGSLLGEHPEIASFDVYAAAACAEVEVLRRFLNEDPGLATRKGGPRGWSPLLYLCGCRLPEPPERDHLACLRLLLDAGADPNDHFIGYEKYVQTALTGVVGEGEQGIENNPPLRQARAMVELLLDRGAEPNDSQALYNTHFRADTEWLELLLARGLSQGQRVNWDAEGPTTIDFLLCQAAKQGHVRRVQLLLAAGANPDAKDLYNQRPAYVNALRHGHDECAALLLKAGAESSPQPADELRIALQAHDETRVDELLAAKPDLIGDQEAMCELATDGNIAAIKLLLKHRVDVNAPNRNGRLAIQEAAIRNNRELVMLLFDHGSRLDWRDPHYGGSAVGWATAGGNIELREELLDRSRDVFDLTRFGRLEQLKRLLEESPETAQKSTRHGNTPLHLVCGRTPHAQEIIDLLLSKGADPNAKNDDGQTPLAVQEEPDDDAIVELLKARGAREG